MSVSRRDFLRKTDQSSNQPKVGEPTNTVPTAVPTLEDLRAVAPPLAKYTEGPLLDGVWKRPDLSPRDRSIVTVSALIARNQTIGLPYHFNLALEKGVR
jgi:4-carboxymuconolactone decarboxylase